MRQRNEDLEEQVDHLHGKNDELRQEVRDLEDQVEQLQKENDELREELGPFKLKAVWTTDQMRAQQLIDPAVGPVCAAKILGRRLPEKTYIDSRPPKERALWLQWDVLKYEDGLLRQDFPGTHGPITVLVLPEDCRAVAFQQAHFLTTQVHLSCFETLRRLKNEVYWPKMDEDVLRWTDGCEWCRLLYLPPGSIVVHEDHATQTVSSDH